MSDDEFAAARSAVAAALREDLGEADIDLASVAVAGRQLVGAVVARSAGTLAGVEVAVGALRQRGATDVQVLARDGRQVRPGDIVARIQGDAAAVLSAERVALNFLQRLSGVATLTRAYVDAVAGTGARIYDTRKTTPGLRSLERHAVRCGGGHNHRFGLFDVAMVKDNHVDVVGIEGAIAAIRNAHRGVAVILEVRTLDELERALALAPDVVLLDNMDLATLRAAVERGRGRVTTEASGGVTLDTVAAIAATGVDRISVGALTHSAPALDIALDVHVQGRT